MKEPDPPRSNCVALGCPRADGKVHSESDWLYHPQRGGGFTRESGWQFIETPIDPLFTAMKERTSDAS